MTERIDEPVEVVMAYKQGRAVPTVMGWQNRVYKFSQLGYHHPQRLGNRLFHIFTMSDANMTYRLAFDTEALSWQLEEITDGEPS